MKKYFFVGILFLQLISSAFASQDLKEVNVILQEISRLESKKNYLAKNKSLTGRELKRQIHKTSVKIESYNRQLINILAEDTVFEEGNLKKENFDLIDQFQEILKPIFNSLRKISKRPQKIENLNSEIEESYIKLRRVNNALLKVSKEKLEEEKPSMLKNPDFEKAVTDIRFILEEEKNKLLLTKLKHERELLQLQKNEEPWLQQAKKILGGFFLAKIWHLFVSLSCFVIFMALGIAFKKFLFSERFNYGPWEKAFSYSYSSLCFLAASSSAVLVLYLYNDWFLVTLFLLFLSGAIWSLRNLLPLFVQEFKLIMNMGPIREGERIVWNGLPYKIENLAIRSTLENPALEGGKFKISAKYILNLTSRPYVEGEQWFPTAKGDWVEFEGTGLIARVVFQGVEYVELDYLYSGIQKILSTEFLKEKFKVLSHGFWIDFKVGIDYKHASSMGSDVLPSLREKLKEKMSGDSFPVSSDHLRLDYSHISQSSLKLWIRLECEGELAPEKLKLKARLNQYLLDSLHELEISIPYQQIKLHCETDKSKLL